MEWIKKNKTTVAIASGVFAVLGLGGYLAYQLAKEEEEEDQQQSTGNQQQVDVSINKVKKANNGKEYQDKLQKIVSSIQVQKDQQNPACIDFGTIAKILEWSVDLCQEEYVLITKQQRTQRRSLSGEQYEVLVIQQCDQVEQLLSKVQEEIISGLGISQQDFEQSLMLIIQRGLHQQLIYLDMAVKQQLKMKLESTATLDVDKAKEIIKFQNDIIKSQPEYFTNILKAVVANPEMQQKLPQIINIMLCDKVYNEYKIEEEDIVKMLGPHAQTDGEIIQLMQQAEDGMRQLLMSIAPPQMM